MLLAARELKIPHFSSSYSFLMYWRHFRVFAERPIEISPGLSLLADPSQRLVYLLSKSGISVALSRVCFLAFQPLLELPITQLGIVHT